MSRVEEGSTEQITVYEGYKTTGLTDLYVRILRMSDSQLLDWSDMTFKASGWTTVNKVLAEVDATNLPGLYKVTGGLDTSAITNSTENDTYIILPLQTPGTSALLPSPGEMRMGSWTDIAECHLSAAYDSANTITRIAFWLTRNDTKSTPTACTLTWRNEGGTVLFTYSDSDSEVTGPDAQGVYLMVATEGISTRKAYTVDISMTDAIGTVLTTRGVPTAG